LEIIPDDYTARYYYAYAKRKSNPQYLTDFLAADGERSTDGEKAEVLSHLIAASDLRDKYAVETYIRSLDGIDKRAYIDKNERAFAEKRKREEDYEAIPRDVFVCHRSTDAETASGAVAALERDGNKCWISSRNLRPNDSESYWNSIEKNIKLCKVFLVIASEQAMLSPDVKGELDIAAENKKPRLEYKIDDKPHTEKFKHFFDGIPWIDAAADPTSRYHVLCQRVLDELERIKADARKKSEFDLLREQQERLERELRNKTAVSGAVSADGGTLAGLLKKARMFIEDGQFPDAEKTCERISDIDIENAELWLDRLLIEAESRGLDSLSKKCADYTKSNAYAKALRFSDAAAVEQIKTAVENARQNRIEAERLAAEQKAARERIAAEVERQRIAAAAKQQKRKEEELYAACKPSDFKIKRGVLKEYEGRSLWVRIPNGVTSIGPDAFSNCSDLTSITIPASVTSINTSFLGCSGITSITVASGNSEYKSEGNSILSKDGKTLIVGCQTSVIPAGVTSIGEGAFYYCSGITSITIPASVTSIGTSAFSRCSGLTSITIPASVTSIGNNAFNECSGITSITIPASVTRIGNYAFAYCRGLTSIKMRRASSSGMTLGDYWNGRNGSSSGGVIPVTWGYTGE
jgi:hypothetical protein